MLRRAEKDVRPSSIRVWRVHRTSGIFATNPSLAPVHSSRVWEVRCYIARMRASLDPVHDELVLANVLEPVGPDDEEQHLFVDFELASLAEHRLGDSTDPRNIDEARRADWLAHMSQDGTVMALPRKTDWYQKCFWLLDEGKRAGTIALAEPMGTSMARCSSFYLLPEFRNRGLGSRFMRNVLLALDNHGFRLRLDTDWTWQRTVRFYRKLGFWVCHWKRQLDLIWVSKWPIPRIEVGLTEASLSIRRGDTEATLVRAYRKGDRLELEEQAAPERSNAEDVDEDLGDVHYFATRTLSLELAMHGWPLVRSAKQWEETYYADAGPPEALAYKITIWEAYARSRGWIVDTPRIAGLEYPTYDEFQARWAKEQEEYECTMRAAKEGRVG